MPPVDYCPSCEGKKAESHAQQVGQARAQQIELQSTADAAPTPTPGPQPAEQTGQTSAGDSAKPVDSAVQPLLASDLAVQATLARPEVDAASGQDAALRLRGAQAYGAS